MKNKIVGKAFVLVGRELVIRLRKSRSEETAVSGKSVSFKKLIDA